MLGEFKVQTSLALTDSSFNGKTTSFLPNENPMRGEGSHPRAGQPLHEQAVDCHHVNGRRHEQLSSEQRANPQHREQTDRSYMNPLSLGGAYYAA